jgi:hypothetical protein
MTSRLKKMMYHGRRVDERSTLFGLKYGQLRMNEFTHNSGWFNAAGEKIGFGDLSIEDMVRIREELQSGEVFIIVCESDLFATRTERTPYDPEAPGVDWVVDKAMYIIVPGQIISVDRYTSDERTYEYRGALIRVVTGSETGQIIRR